MMNTRELNFEQYQRSNTTIFSALLIGQVAFAGFAVFSNQTVGALIEEDQVIRTTFMLLVPLFFLATFAISKFLVAKKLKNAKLIRDVKAKLIEYRSINIIRYALLEGTIFFAIITYLLTGEFLLLGFAVVMVLLFTTYYPSKDKLMNELDVSTDEQAIIDDPDFRIYF